MILDQYERPINFTELKEPQSGTLAHIPNRWDDHPGNGLTPGRLHRILTGAEQGDMSTQTQLFRDIEERDPHVFGDFSRRRRKVLTREWDIHEPENSSAASKRATAFVKGWLKSFNDFEDVLFDMTEAIGFAYSCHEMKWGALDGVPVPVKIMYRPQEYLKLKRVDNRPATAMSGDRTDLRLDDSSADGQELWAGGWLIHVHKAKSGYLDRVGLFRVVAWMYLIKHHALTDLPRFLEVYGIPPRIGKYDPDSPTVAKDKQLLFNAIRRLGHDAGGVIPNGMIIELLQAASGNVEAFINAAKMCDQYNSAAILGRSVVASGALGGGSGQNESNNADVADDLNIADCKQVARTITQELIWPVAGYFGLKDMRECPQFRFNTQAAADRKAVAEGISAAKTAGARVGRLWAHEQMQIPVPAKDDELLDGPEPAPAPGTATNTTPSGEPAEPGSPGAADVSPNDDTSGQPVKKPDPKATLAALFLASLAQGRMAPVKPPRDPLDDAVDAMLGGWKPAMDDLLAPIMKAVADAAATGETLASLQARLPELLGNMDTTALTEQLARGQFLANLAGQAGLLDPAK